MIGEGSVCGSYTVALPIACCLGVQGVFSPASNLTPRKRKLDLAREVRGRARRAVGMPPRERVISDKRRKPPKHKKKLLEEELL